MKKLNITMLSLNAILISLFLFCSTSVHDVSAITTPAATYAGIQPTEPKPLPSVRLMKDINKDTPGFLLYRPIKVKNSKTGQLTRNFMFLYADPSTFQKEQTMIYKELKMAT